MAKVIDEYNRKRDFVRTPEPRGTAKQSRVDNKGRFVVQKHDATRLHYDFRLEDTKEGVLKSWAVPKGISLDPKVKRLAVLVEDHPIDYLLFEGVIPEGNYGAGTVIVWDTGSYRNVTERDGEEVPIEEALDAGHAVVWLEGRKLQGAWTLQRIGRGKEERWLLVKKRDDGADARRNPVRTQPESVLSGKTIEDLREK